MSHSKSVLHAKSLFQDLGYVRSMLPSYKYCLGLDKEWHLIEGAIRKTSSGFWLLDCDLDRFWLLFFDHWHLEMENAILNLS